MKTQQELKEESRLLAEELEQKMKEMRPRMSIPISLLRMGAKDPRLRTKLLEFVDVLPQLRSTRDIQEHFEMYLGSLRHLFPLPMRLGSYAMKMPMAYKSAAILIRWLISNKLAPYFIVKDEGSINGLRRAYAKEGSDIIVDFLGESVVSEGEANYFFEKYMNGMRRARLDAKILGLSGHPLYIAIKPSSLYQFFSPENYRESKRVVGEKFENILRIAQNTNSFPTLDAEHYELDGLIEDIFCETIMGPDFQHTTQVGIAKQVYRKDSFASCVRLVELAKKRGIPFTIRLTKGAYWDTEVALAEQKGWQCPVFNEKRDTDENFDRILYYLMENWKYVHVSPATHNPEAIAFAYHVAKEFGALNDPNFTFQVLYGLGESARRALCQDHLPVLVYTPIGDLETGMSYFARRILENTANEGFLLRLIQN